MNEQRAKWCWPRAPVDVPRRLFSPGRCIGSSCFRTHDLEDVVGCARCRAWFEPHPNVCRRSDGCFDVTRSSIEAARSGRTSYPDVRVEQKALQGLLAGLTILAKYASMPPRDAGRRHEVLWILDVHPNAVSEEDRHELARLGLTWDEHEAEWRSHWDDRPRGAPRVVGDDLRQERS